MRFFQITLAISAALLIGTQFSLPALAEEPSVTDEILEILKKNDQISDQEYEDLKKRAEEAEKTSSSKVKGTPLQVSWDKGLRMTDPNGHYKIKMGGRIMTDFAWFDADDTLPEFENGAEFRRARLYVAGTIYDRVIFKAQYDFAGGDADFKDVYMGLKKVPGVGTIKVGHFKEPYSLEELTSSKYITFMERSISNVAPGRNTGLGLNNTFTKEKRGTWAAGIFYDAGAYGDSTDENSYNVTGRMTGLPWYDDKGTKLLHLGLSYSHQFRDEGTARYRQRPEAHLGEYLINTDSITADAVDLITPEIALVVGPFSAQSEYTQIMVDRPDGSEDVEFNSYYVEGSYFITGEHRKYKKSAGAFSRVSPKKNFGKDGGAGAWQLALRYSHANYNDEDIVGGELSDISAGVNWHLNPNTRIMANYVNGDLKDVGKVNLYQMRFQVDF